MLDQQRVTKNGGTVHNQPSFSVDAGISSHNTANAVLKQAGLAKAF